ncbi:MAG TPA: TolC family protein [Candidatus Acidoferrales bacterium]|nr:TolC family protein [Candidatus Acidoferrales bacterium]
MKHAALAALALAVTPVACLAQGTQTQAAAAQTDVQMMAPEGSSGPPLTLTLPDALQRAEGNDPQFQAAVTGVKNAREGVVQARAAMLPAISATTQYLNAQGNGISPVGRFVTQDGVHVYRGWGVLHEGMPGDFFIKAGPRAAAYQKAMAQAQQDVARRGLAATVTTDYYALIVSQRAYATAQEALERAGHFLQTSEALERGGEAAHTDVIRFQLEYNQEKQVMQDAELAMANARATLAVLLFPKFNENFTVVDDLDTPPPLPAFNDVQTMAKSNNPQIRAALAAYGASKLNVAIARAAFYPSLSIDVDYGIEANAFALRSVNDTAPGRRQPNLGYFATYALNVPVFDWGSLHSKLKQAKNDEELQRVNATYAQRQLLSQLYSLYNEAAIAQNQIETLHNSANLAAQNLQLVTMQYKAGEAAVLQVLDAETALNAARNADAAGKARYRNALAALQTLTGGF